METENPVTPEAVELAAKYDERASAHKAAQAKRQKILADSQKQQEATWRAVAAADNEIAERARDLSKSGLARRSIENAVPEELREAVIDAEQFQRQKAELVREAKVRLSDLKVHAEKAREDGLDKIRLDAMARLTIEAEAELAVASEALEAADKKFAEAKRVVDTGIKKIKAEHAPRAKR